MSSSNRAPTAASRPIAAALLVALALVSVLAPRPALAEAIVTSPADERAYDWLRLDNGMKVVLISDPASEVAAASLDVHVGSGDEPDARPGLAHFLEHMLFLGTEQFPEAGEYRAYINANGGSQNAYTAYANTNYHFEVEAGALPGALDRFAAFFTSPLLDARYVERERNAVHAEYMTRLRNDGARSYEAFKKALNPAHPMARFFVGNLDTLADRTEGSVRDDLMAFYEAHYHAGNMALAVLGRESLDELRAMVLARFTAVPAGAPRAAVRPSLFAAGALPARLEVQPFKERRSVSLTFPTPPRRADYASKPAAYVANMLGHEGVGSLLSELRRRGLANGLSAGGGLSHDDASTFEVAVSLTADGLARLDEVIGLTFRTIDLIRSTGPERARFDEQARLAATDFRFMERGEPGAMTRGLAAAAHRYPARDLLRAGYAYDRYSPEVITRLLDALRPDNVLVTVVAPDLDTDAHTEYYNAPYRLSPIAAATLAAWKAVARPDTLALPARNDFVADDLELIAGDGAVRPPERLLDEPGFALWHAADTSFARPLASFYLSVRSPRANDSARNAALTRFLVAMVNEQLTEPLYPAVIAGLGVSVYPHLRGLSMRVHGYSDKHGLLVEQAVAALGSPELDPATFERVRESLTRSWRNQALGSPYGRAMAGLRNALMTPHWSAAELLEASEGITIDAVREFVPRFFEKLQLVALSHGNVTEEEARSLAARVRATMMTGREAVAVPRAEVVRLKGDERGWMPVLVDHDDVAVVRYYQGQERSHRARAAAAMVGHLLSSPFYTRLRTEEQLGYVVFSSSMPLMHVPGLVFVVQSPNATAEHIEARFDAFLETARAELEALPPAGFDAQVEALLARLLERDGTLRDRTNRYWNELDHPSSRLDDRERLADALRALRPAEVLSAFDSLLFEQARRVSVHASRTARSAPLADGHQPITDRQAFKAARDRFNDAG